MRLISGIILLAVYSACFGQQGQLYGKIAKSDSLIEFGSLMIKISTTDSVIAETRPDAVGNFAIENIPYGLYRLTIERIGARAEVIDSVVIAKDTSINFGYPLPCRYLYAAGQKPSCIGGHTDHLIPIVYGLPSKKTMAKAKRGILYLGGCLVSDCDPRFYCTIHKKDL